MHINHCLKACSDEWGAMTNGGDLNTENADGIVVGQMFCDSYGKEITNKNVS